LGGDFEDIDNVQDVVELLQARNEALVMPIGEQTKPAAAILISLCLPWKALLPQIKDVLPFCCAQRAAVCQDLAALPG